MSLRMKTKSGRDCRSRTDSTRRISNDSERSWSRPRSCDGREAENDKNEGSTSSSYTHKHTRTEEEEDFDWESGSEEENDKQGVGEVDNQNDDNLNRMQQVDSKSWDHAFLILVYAMRPFERDDSHYREARAVETFNAAADVMKEYKRLHPNAISACPHVALGVLPRQQVRAATT